MTTQYDRVSYPDKVQFAEMDEDQEVGHQTGNGIYNDYTVQLPKQYRESFKIACFRIEKTRRTAFIICGILVVLIMVILISVIAAHAHITAKNQAAQSPKEEYGLLAYPTAKDGNSVIAFDHTSYASYKQYMESMDFHMKDYDIIMQENQLDTYTKCSKNKTSESLPPGQVCMQTPITFGPNCSNLNLYGYGDKVPCILLVLKLEEGVKPSAHISDDDSNKELKKSLDELAAQGLIPVTCEGKTEQDQSNMKQLNTATNIMETEIAYHPFMGFPLYFFPVKSDNAYINPAVMVQFNSVKMNTDVTVRCTAWVLDDIFETEFTFRMA